MSMHASTTATTHGRSPYWTRSRRGTPPPAEDPHTPLGIYFREMSGHDLMTPQQERDAARHILAARAALWRAVGAYAPFVEGIVQVVRDTLTPDEGLKTALRRTATAARRVRDRQTRANRERFAAAVAALAEALASIDTDGEAADPIVADLERIAAGSQRPRALCVTLPPTGSVPFSRYVEGVREAARELALAKDRFVRANLRLVVTMARRFDHGRLPLPDLIQEGNLGLMKAVDRFDPGRGFRFSTYASWWIRHAISRALADKGREVRVPVHMIDVHHKVKRARRRFATVQGREPTDEELAEVTGVTLEKLQRMRHCLLDSGPSLDSPIQSEDGRTVGDLLEDETIPAATEALQAKAMGDKVRELLGSLRPIEADVLRKRFGLDEAEPLTLREIGEQYSLSRERIRQVQEQALGKIRRELRRHRLM